MLKLLLISAALTLSGCGTYLGYKLGDMSYVHKPHCAAPFMEWQDEETINEGLVSTGDNFDNYHTQVVAGHWHYYCPRAIKGVRPA